MFPQELKSHSNNNYQAQQNQMGSSVVTHPTQIINRRQLTPPKTTSPLCSSSPNTNQQGLNRIMRVTPRPLRLEILPRCPHATSRIYSKWDMQLRAFETERVQLEQTTKNSYRAWRFPLITTTRGVTIRATVVQLLVPPLEVNQAWEMDLSCNKLSRPVAISSELHLMNPQPLLERVIMLEIATIILNNIKYKSKTSSRVLSVAALTPGLETPQGLKPSKRLQVHQELRPVRHLNRALTRLVPTVTTPPSEWTWAANKFTGSSRSSSNHSCLRTNW